MWWIGEAIVEGGGWVGWGRTRGWSLSCLGLLEAGDVELEPGAPREWWMFVVLRAPCFKLLRGDLSRISSFTKASQLTASLVNGRGWYREI